MLPQIAPGDSVKGRKSSPYAAWSPTGTSHQSDVASTATAARHANPPIARPGTPRTRHMYASRSSGPISTKAVTAALMPPPLSATTSAKRTGHHHPPPLRTPRAVAYRSHGSAA